jgi:tetratricopeptide (TPR) repeat protein
MVDGDHEHRIGRGPYAYLGVLEDADDETISRAASTLARRWRQAEQDDTLPEATRTKARELHAGVALAQKIIGSQKNREAYNRRRESTGELFITATGLKEGPPRNTAASSSKSRGGKSRRGTSRSSSAQGNASLIERARKLMADGEFRGAVSLLKQAREADPSSPEVFAALGWATWKVGGERAAEDAEDYLRLALTFDARSTEALTSLGKLYLSQSRTDHARAVLKMLVRLDPDSVWAKRKLAEVDTAAANDSGTTS